MRYIKVWPALWVHSNCMEDARAAWEHGKDFRFRIIYENECGQTAVLPSPSYCSIRDIDGLRDLGDGDIFLYDRNPDLPSATKEKI